LASFAVALLSLTTNSVTALHFFKVGMRIIITPLGQVLRNGAAHLNQVSA
jgi:hypothetical protein